MKIISNVIQKLNRRDIKIFPKISKKIKLSIVLALITLSVFITKSSFAQNYISDKQSAITKGNNQESWLNESLYSNLMSLQIAIGGTIPDTILNRQPPTSYYQPGGLIGGAHKIVAYAFNPPASGIEYFAQLKDSFLGKPAYAQGYGFTSLTSGILPLWKIFRNVVYVLFSIIFIVVGIMIMFRVKIDPQTVISIQNSIPKLITALILVTFSYAIAGLLIDLIFVIMGLFISIIFNGIGVDSSQSLLDTRSPWQDLLNIAKMSPFTQDRLSNFNWNTFSQLVKRLVPTSTELMFLYFTITSFFGPIVAVISALGALSSTVLVTLLISIFALINILRFIFGLFKVYLSVLFQIIFAPFEIAMGALPNSKIGFSSWALKLFGNLAVFPATVIFLVIVNILIDYCSPKSFLHIKYASNDIWAPPLLTGGNVFLSAIIGLGGLLLLPKLPQMIPEFIFMLKPSPWGKAIGEAATNNFIVGGATKAGSLIVSSAVRQGVDEVTGKLRQNNARTPRNGAGIGGQTPGNSNYDQANQNDKGPDSANKNK